MVNRASLNNVEKPDTRLYTIDGWILFLTVLWSLLFIWLSVAQYRAYNDGWTDLEFMSQSIWTATKKQPLMHTSPILGQRSRLNVHVELIYFLFVPFYKLWPDPQILLIVQSALFGLGGVPLYSWAKRRFESRSVALMLTAVYWLYPVAQTAVLYGFHGDTLAMPFLLFLLNALDARKWRSYVFWLVFSLSCRFYIAVPIFFLGAVLLLEGRRRFGVVTSIIAVVWGATAFFVIRPAFAPPGPPEHIHVTSLGYLQFYFGQFFYILSVSYLLRFATAVVVFLPALWMGWRAGLWLLPALSVAIPAIMSSGPNFSFFIRYHHYASAIPFFMLAIIEGVARIRKHQPPSFRKRGRTWYGEVFLTVGITLIFSAAFVETPLSPRFWRDYSDTFLNPMTYGRTSRDLLKDKWLSDFVPEEGSLAASTFLVSHLSNRYELYNGVPDDLEKIDYAVLDALFDYPVLVGEDFVSVTYDAHDIAVLLQNPDFGLTAARDGLLLFARDAPYSERLHQQIEVIPAVGSHSNEVQGEIIVLLESEIVPLGDRRFRVVCDWQAQFLPSELPQLLAVARIAGIDHMRVVHLPTFVLYPTTEWGIHEIVRETYDFEIPPYVPPGKYSFMTGWYNTAERTVYKTASDTRVIEEITLGKILLR